VSAAVGAAVSTVLLTAASCQRGGRPPQPLVAITEIPPAAQGGSERMVRIAGHVDGVRSGQAIVLFARSGLWWVQPFRKEPMTMIRRDGSWSSSTHLGTEYAALLVRDGYQPAPTLPALPDVGGNVLAIATVRGQGESPIPASRTIEFSGYRWDIRQRVSERGGYNRYSADNVRVAADGAVHLLLNRSADDWTSSEVVLTRTLGYGTYEFVVRSETDLDPAALLTFFTYDESGPPDTYRALEIQIQRPSPHAAAAGQYSLQPFYVASNLARFEPPAGPLTHTLRWEPGRAVFVTVRGRRPVLHAGGGAEHEFTVGVPAPGQEHIGINLCYFRKSPVPPARNVEVVIERFQYFP
jgi:hypothetical protein